jgi:molecular chaperone DnaJ
LSGNDTFYESFGPSQFTAARVERELARTAKITFREAFEGVNKEMTFTVDEPCDICGGSGAAPGYKPTTCSVCRGSGQIAVGRAISPCAKCDGLGYIIEHPCTQCHKGIMRHDSSFVISIPAGIRDGDVIKLPLQVAGRVGHSEIKVTVKVEPSAVFSRNLRNPADLEVIVPITYSEAALGASVKIPTPDRTIQLHIPPSTASGKRFRVSGKGMPKFGIEGERGDLYARVQLQVPEELSHAQKRLISELGTHDPEDLRTALFTALRH